MAHGLTPPPSSVASAPSGVQRAVEAKKDDSGIVDLAAASQADPQASVRALSTPLATQGLFDDDSMHSQRPPPMSAPPGAPFGGYGQPMQPAPSIPPVPASIPAATASQDSFASSPIVAPAAQAAAPLAATPEKKKGGTVIALVLGGVVALSAAAAGGVFYMKSHKANAVATTAPVATTAQPVAQAEPPVAKATPAPAEPTPAAEPTTDPNALPAAAPHGKVAVAPKGGAKIALAPKAEAPKADGPTKVVEKDLGAAPSGPAGDLGKAMEQEVGPGKKLEPAAVVLGGGATGNVPQKPSQGAVTGALGAVLPGARACLGPDDPISKASVVFASAGTVQSVTVSGAAAGKPAEACIKSALMKAKLQPFAEPTYSANITVRHN
ncbi:MAG TPA: hypothetical protein VM925_05165 [Labilithrix sp.]|nr:hypothetical protein [Labilithrix sp.]